jgi:hypothetical protein
MPVQVRPPAPAFLVERLDDREASSLLTVGRTSILFSKMMKWSPKDSSGLPKLTARASNTIKYPRREFLFSM